LDNKVFDIVDKRCNHEVQFGQRNSHVAFWVYSMRMLFLMPMVTLFM